ncbi:MAG TPA: glucosidase [Candidatus Polarisedimenticolia bacterium]|nr:glucosidase [Candidatus Polarisedimenticolia bacterium]
MKPSDGLDPEQLRLAEDATRQKNWKRWGPYLSERQWGTIREDYSADGDCWSYFPHDHARSRTYRWGEDGLLGLADRECRLCFAPALWNGRDPILKERLFGLSGPEGNHGEDVKESYFYLDATPTHSYMKALYKYPHAAYPYDRVVKENRERGRDLGEWEIADSGLFDDSRYFDLFVEYAKDGPDDILIRLTASNRGPETASLHLLPTLWFRNTWRWDAHLPGAKPEIRLADRMSLAARHATLGEMRLAASPSRRGVRPTWLFTENETNTQRIFGTPSASTYVKDAFHEALIAGRAEAISLQGPGTKAAAHYLLEVPAGESEVIHLRLFMEASPPADPLGKSFAAIFALRQQEADAFYAARLPASLTDAQAAVCRQGYAGLLWSKQFYHYVVREWLEGDPGEPPPPRERRNGRNHEWTHIYNRDVISMPDKWEYPWYAAWDLAFHMIPFSKVDPAFAKEQLVLFLREWYMHPNGQIPAYEFAFGDVNPPVHAWAAWRIYKMTGGRGGRDRVFLERVFQKLLLNFTWWVNRKDPDGKNVFSGGFLGLDNIGVFDRSKPLPNGGHLEQADGTAWMAFYASTMMSMALELAREEPAYEDMASKFFEHFVAITDAMNQLGGTGLWDEEDGFYYDRLHLNGTSLLLKVRSIVGLIPLFAVEVIEEAGLHGLDGFKKRAAWFLENRSDLANQISYMETRGEEGHRHFLLAIPSRERLSRVLRTLLDEEEFLSPYGIRSLSRVHRDRPYRFEAAGQEYRVGYEPGEGLSGRFGGNSNWRGPIWFPVNFLLVEALERYHHFYRDGFKMECPTGSGRMLTLKEVSRELARRMASLFLPDRTGRRPVHGDDPRFAGDPHWRDLILFYEYFHGDHGRGLGASHQTGWTALAVSFLEDLAADRLKGTGP